MVKRRRSYAKEIQRVMAQLRKWCDGRDFVGLRITVHFLDLSFAGHLSAGTEKWSFVFESAKSAVVSAIAPIAFTAVEVKEENGRICVRMDRKEGRITIWEMETLEDLLTAMPATSKFVQ